MSNDLEKPNNDLVPAVDSFAGYVDAYEADGEEAVNQSMIDGTRIKFSADAKWTDAQNVELPALILLVVDVKRVVNHWIDGRPSAKTMVLAPGERWPDIKKLNTDAPESEWRTDPNSGEFKGPWEPQRLLYLLEPTTLDKYTYPTNTAGGKRAISELTDKITWAQKVRPGARPLVQLSKIWMPTKYRGRMRPHFIIQKEWMLPDGTMGELIQQSAPLQIAGPAKPAGVTAKFETSTGTAPIAQPAKEKPQTARPTIGPEMDGDAIPF
jgi:hypothetical protein